MNKQQSDAMSGFFEYAGTEASTKAGCGHLGVPSSFVDYKGKKICTRCATLVMGGKTASGATGGKQEVKAEQKQEAQAAEQEAKTEESEGGESEGEAEGKGGGGEGDGDDSPVMHSEFDPAKQAKADKARDAAIKLVSQRMDNGQKEIELAKKAFDSHGVLIGKHEARIGKLEDGKAGVNEEAVIALIKKHSKLPPIITVTGKSETGETTSKVVEGTHHRLFALLLQTASARLPDGHRMNVWLRGPAGSGKTTAAANVAKALGLQFAFNGALDSEYKLKGFVDATGRCVSTAFRRIWTEGGVYLFDEVDASLPAAVLGFNAALANGACDFPDANIPRHKDCIIIAAANTFGGGATADYVGRAKQDAAFLDRFVQMDWDIDQDLETRLTGNTQWSAYVQNARKRVEQRGLKGIIISPRASLFGASMLASGVDSESVIQMTIRKGMTDDQWKAIDLPKYRAQA